MKLRLGVNVDHVATVRQARGTDYPRPVDAALLCRQAGAHSITVHLREDRRHIQEHDVLQVQQQVDLPLNLEMASDPDIINFALKHKPDEVCLVPERREELTTEGGLDVAGQQNALMSVVHDLSSAGICVSLFIDPDLHQLDAAAALKAPFVELHTGAFCDAQGAEADAELERLIKGAEYAHQLGLRVNAGHGINLENISRILEMPHLEVLNIGHSIIARALMVGMESAVKEMLAAMKKSSN